MTPRAAFPPARRAWREPLAWLVWSLPALVVCAGFATLAIALRAGGDDAVSFDVRRTAQIQQEDLGADRRARALGLSARLVRDRATGAAVLELDGAGSDAPRLALRLQHPVRADADLSVWLVRDGSVWRGRVPLEAHAWTLRLEAPRQAWRLAGRLAPDADEARLLPRLRD